MAKLIFKAEDVRRVVEQSIAQRDNQSDYLSGYDSKTHKCTYSKPEAPAVLLVHDDGVYLMSNGEKRDIVITGAKPGQGKSFVAYAKGCNPSVDGEACYDNSNALVGGDDFGECLPWADKLLKAIQGGAKMIVVNLGRNSISFTARLPLVAE